ncbi:MAG: hypothetical protein GJU73_04875 [Ferrovum sp.]|jgi:hypothetical protein|nr:hypothetical protein [Ferrovum sp.]
MSNFYCLPEYFGDELAGDFRSGQCRRYDTEPEVAAPGLRPSIDNDEHDNTSYLFPRLSVRAHNSISAMHQAGLQLVPPNNWMPDPAGASNGHPYRDRPI